jgi:hypothetical protein
MSNVVFDVQRVPRGQGLREQLDDPVTVASFPDADAAHADCARRESEARAAVNPFAGPDDWLGSRTGLDADRLHDWLLDCGADPPAPDAEGRRDWAGWWERSAPHWGEEQRARVWQALDRVQLFRVVQRRARRKVYVVVEIGWHWHDEPPLTAGPEGGRALEAFSTRARANERRAELDRQSQSAYANEPDDYGPDYDLSVRRGQPMWQEGYAGRAAPFYEVVEVEREDEA